jgi:hypothetical protein
MRKALVMIDQAFSPSVAPKALRLRPGEWVAVRSEAEIVSTLDSGGMLDGLPFMPEMLQFCGRRFRVRARADRTVVQKLGVRRMRDTVHLDDLRCDGGFHDDCSRGCTLFWKEAWLARLAASPSASPSPAAATRRDRLLKTRDADGWICQATHLDRATSHQPLLDPGQVVRALHGEKPPLMLLLKSFGILAYDVVQWRLGRREWNQLSGPCARTPAVSLELQPGERVRVRRAPEIFATLDAHGWNRGMEFSREMLPYCGREMTVLRRVKRVLLDQARQMREVVNTVILEGAVYQALNRRLVPRREHMFWRECWLERVQARTP